MRIRGFPLHTFARRGEVPHRARFGEGRLDDVRVCRRVPDAAGVPRARRAHAPRASRRIVTKVRHPISRAVGFLVRARRARAHPRGRRRG